MKKNEPIAKVLLADLNSGEKTDEQKRELIADALREYAVDLLNKALYMKEKNVDWETARDLMQIEGVDFDGKTKKFKQS